MRILLAEDEPLLRMLLTDMCDEEGHAVEQAADGLHAIALLRATPPIDVLITDINMPGADGFAVAREARAIDPSVLLIFLSALDHRGRSEQFAEPWHFFQKPFPIAKLISTIRPHSAPTSS